MSTLLHPHVEDVPPSHCASALADALPSMLLLLMLAMYAACCGAVYAASLLLVLQLAILVLAEALKTKTSMPSVGARTLACIVLQSCPGCWSIWYHGPGQQY